MIHAAVQFAREKGGGGKGVGFTLDVDLRSAAHVTGVFGASGSGKTTLLHAIAGLIRPDAGRISIDDRPVFDRALGVNMPTHRRGIGMVFQEPRLFPHRRVRDNLRYGRTARAAGPAELERLADLLEIRPLLDRRPAGLSGGEAQRVALARVLLNRPRALLMDEPLASLDVRLRQAALGVIARAIEQANLPVLYVSHDLTEILRLTDHIAILDAGRLVAAGRYTDLAHDPRVWSVVRERGASNVFTAQVLLHDVEERTTVVELGEPAGGEARGGAGGGAGGGRGGQTLLVPMMEAGEGRRVTLSVPPWDIALATGPVAAVSIRNQLRGIVTRVSVHERGVLVEVDVGTRLLAEISRSAAATLGIREGAAVVCLIKTQSIECTGSS